MRAIRDNEPFEARFVLETPLSEEERRKREERTRREAEEYRAWKDRGGENIVHFTREERAAMRKEREERIARGW